MKSIPRSEVVGALEISLAAAISTAKLPRLSEPEHSALVSLRTLARVLQIQEIDARITDLLTTDIAECGNRLYRDLLGDAI